MSPASSNRGSDWRDPTTSRDDENSYQERHPKPGRKVAYIDHKGSRDKSRNERYTYSNSCDDQESSTLRAHIGLLSIDPTSNGPKPLKTFSRHFASSPGSRQSPR